MSNETSSLSIARDGVTITISGPAWLIKDVYDRETGNPIRVEQATPEAKAIPKDWPVFQLGDRVCLLGSNFRGSISGTEGGPRFYSVLWDDGTSKVHNSLVLKKVDGEPKAEPTIEALTKEERKERTEKARAARHPKKVAAEPLDTYASSSGSIVARNRRTGRVHIGRTIQMLEVGSAVTVPVSAGYAKQVAHTFGYKVNVTRVPGGKRVERVQ